jgi:hypothetical protein
VAAFLTDNDVSLHLAAELHTLGHAATTALAQGLRAATDARQLLTAVQHDWILVTHNYRDFLLLHQAWILWRQAGPGYLLPPHPGVLVIPQQRWNDPEAAHEIHTFMLTTPPLPNMLYQWMPSVGWVSRR